MPAFIYDFLHQAMTILDNLLRRPDPVLHIILRQSSVNCAILFLADDRPSHFKSIPLKVILYLLIPSLLDDTLFQLRKSAVLFSLVRRINVGVTL